MKLIELKDCQANYLKLHFYLNCYQVQVSILFLFALLSFAFILRIFQLNCLRLANGKYSNFFFPAFTRLRIRIRKSFS